MLVLQYTGFRRSYDDEDDINDAIFDDEDDIFNDPAIEPCSVYEVIGYRCVPYYTCDECNNIIVDGAGLIDPKNKRKKRDTCKTSK